MKYRIWKLRDRWQLSIDVGAPVMRHLGQPYRDHGDAVGAMDYDAWLMNRDLFPGKTFTEARRAYRRQRMERLGSHVETNRVRADRAPEAVDERQALVAGALVHPVRADGV